MNLWSRRHFITATASAGALTGLPARAADARPPRKLKLGVIGNGGRGAWIAKLFQAHGGYEPWAVADYFQEVADQCGDVLGVDRTRRFATLSGYKRLLESGVEAVAIETPPYFLPEQASAAVEAGLHVYMAKPVAADVPGTLRVQAAAERAGRQGRCFFVDYQMPTDAVNREVVRRIHAGGLGQIAQVSTVGLTKSYPELPRSAPREHLLRQLLWINEVALGCDYHGNFDIHAIDAALWALRERPVAASGLSRICRPEPHRDARDVCSILFEYASGVVHNHYGQALRNSADTTLSAVIHGTEAHAQLNYWGRAMLRGGPQHFGGGAVENLYQAGAERNIAAFHTAVSAGDCSNPTVARSIDGCLACILGREAAARGARLTMAALLKENRKLEADLTGLKT